jgi:hypothetical protein
MVLRQFLARENEGKDKRWQNNMREFMACECSNDFRLYHSRPITLDQGFDAVRVVNPAQGALVPYADLLLPQ